MQFDLWQRRIGWLSLVAVILAAGGVAQLRAADEAEGSAAADSTNPAVKAAADAAAEVGKAAEVAADQAMKLAQKAQADISKKFEVQQEEIRKQGEKMHADIQQRVQETQQRMAEQQGMAKKQAEQLRAFYTTKADGNQGRFWLGVECREASPELQAQLDLNEQGLVVLRVAPESPAAAAGLKQHDVLIRVGDAKLVHVVDLAKSANAVDGKPLDLAIIRAGKPQNVTVQPAERQLENVQVIAKPAAGMVLQNFQFQGVKIPENTSISVVRKGQEPATVLVQRGDEKWDVKADDLSKLPDDLRPVIEQMLGGVPFGGKFNVYNTAPATLQLDKGAPPNGANWQFYAPNFQYKLVSPEPVVPAAPAAVATIAVPPAPATAPAPAPAAPPKTANVTARVFKSGQPAPDVMQRLDQVTRELERTQQDLKNLRDAIKSVNEPKGEKE
jgi:membrane-associated protease RseP (regulator of RpoE activity)